jgi:hypothetical protein
MESQKSSPPPFRMEEDLEPSQAFSNFNWLDEIGNVFSNVLTDPSEYFSNWNFELPDPKEGTSSSSQSTAPTDASQQQSAAAVIQGDSINPNNVITTHQTGVGLSRRDDSVFLIAEPEPKAHILGEMATENGEGEENQRVVLPGHPGQATGGVDSFSDPAVAAAPAAGVPLPMGQWDQWEEFADGESTQVQNDREIQANFIAQLEANRQADIQAQIFETSTFPTAAPEANRDDIWPESSFQQNPAMSGDWWQALSGIFGDEGELAALGTQNFLAPENWNTEANYSDPQQMPGENGKSLTKMK